MKHILIALIKLYRLTFSPLVGHHCRFEPTCSRYGIEALQKHGAIKGSALTIWRIMRCNPWGGMGYDPVPEVKKDRKEKSCQCCKIH